MNDRDDGGQAFPVPKLILSVPPADRKGLETMRLVSSGGMSLRDWFAGQAIAAGCPSHIAPVNFDRWIYEMADKALTSRQSTVKKG